MLASGSRSQKVEYSSLCRGLLARQGASLEMPPQKGTNQLVAPRGRGGSNPPPGAILPVRDVDYFQRLNYRQFGISEIHKKFSSVKKFRSLF